jgi:hypothetical protein
VYVAANVATPFSRYLAGPWAPGRPILQKPLRVLVVFANPKDLVAKSLAVVDVTAEWQMLQGATADLPVALTSFPSANPASSLPCAGRAGL